MAGALLNNPPLRINDLAPFNGNIDWDNGKLNTAGGASTVNIEGYNRLTTRWQDIWSGGSNENNLKVNGGYVKLAFDFGAATLTSISSYDETHGLYEEDNTGDGNLSAPTVGTVTHDVLIIDMDRNTSNTPRSFALPPTTTRPGSAGSRACITCRRSPCWRRTSVSATTVSRVRIHPPLASRRPGCSTSFPIRMPTRCRSVFTI
jgi:hypothetical protein